MNNLLQYFHALTSWSSIHTIFKYPAELQVTIANSYAQLPRNHCIPQSLSHDHESRTEVSEGLQ